MKKPSTYAHFSPSRKLADCVDSFWVHHNPNNEFEQVTIAPDSYFKILMYVQHGKLIQYFKTGIWTEPKEISIPPFTHTIGCRFNILAPEYIFQEEFASLLDSSQQLPTSFLNINRFNFQALTVKEVIKQWENELTALRTKKSIAPHKIRLAEVIYQAKGSLNPKELADQIYLTNRTINRYLNRYIGIPLIKYIAIQRAFQAYLTIRKGDFSPTEDFYDQAHFIREIKKHTGESPRKIFYGINDRFIQLRNIHAR